MFDTELLLCVGGTAAGIGEDTENLANLAVSDKLSDLNANGEIARPHSLHQEELALLRLINKDLRLLSVDSERLLAEDMLARLQAEHDILEVVGVRGSDVDDVDIGILNQFLVGTVDSWRGRDLHLLYELLSTVLGAGGNCSNLMNDIACPADGGVDEEILAEC